MWTEGGQPFGAGGPLALYDPLSGAIAGAGALGAGAQIFGAQTAAQAQIQAAQLATNAQLQMFGQTQQNLAPFIAGGKSTLGPLLALLGIRPGGVQTGSTITAGPDGTPMVVPGGPAGLTGGGAYSKLGTGLLTGPTTVAENALSQYVTPALGAVSPAVALAQQVGTQVANTQPGTWSPTQASLENTPGYQFALQQGLRATQNSLAASGLAGSGAAAMAAGNYATGLASQTWPQVFQTWLAQQQLGQQQEQLALGGAGTALGGAGTALSGAATGLQGAGLGLQGAQALYNMLVGPTQLGATSAAGQGQLSAQVGGQVGSNIIGAGNAAAGAATATGQAIAGGASNTANSLVGLNVLNALTGGSIFGNNSSGGVPGGGTWLPGGSTPGGFSPNALIPAQAAGSGFA